MSTCLDCNSYTLEELLRLVVSCDGDDIQAIRTTDVSTGDYIGGCLDCTEYLTITDIFRKALDCTDDIYSIRVNINAVETVDCNLCNDSSSTEDLVRQTVVCNGADFAFNVVNTSLADDCNVCGTFSSIDDWVRRSIVCDVNGNKYFRIVALEE